MRKLNLPLKIVFTLVIIGLGYMLYRTLFDPYFFEQTKKKRYNVVKEQLRDIAKAQDAYKQIKGEYADNFDSLVNVCKTGELMLVKTIGTESDTVENISVEQAIEIFNLDPNLPDSLLYTDIDRKLNELYKKEKAGEKITHYLVRDTVYAPVLTQVQFNTSLDSLKYIPFSKGDEFEMHAQINYVGPGRVKVPVYEVIAYNSSILKGLNRGYYKSKEGIKLGSLTEASTDITDIILMDEK